jgi:hypothetical protein
LTRWLQTKARETGPLFFDGLTSTTRPRTVCSMHWDLKRSVRFAVVLGALANAPTVAHAGGAAVVTQSAEVRAAPSGDAKAVTQAPVNEPVQILDRRGAWYEVSSSSGWRGWLRMASIKLTSLTQKKSSSVALPGEGTAVIGVRGMDEASLARAQPDYAALNKLKQYRATPQDADRFAAELQRGAGR